MSDQEPDNKIMFAIMSHQILEHIKAWLVHPDGRWMIFHTPCVVNYGNIKFEMTTKAAEWWSGNTFQKSRESLIEMVRGHVINGWEPIPVDVFHLWMQSLRMDHPFWELKKVHPSDLIDLSNVAQASPPPDPQPANPTQTRAQRRTSL